jgi:hypothetical protein
MSGKMTDPENLAFALSLGVEIDKPRVMSRDPFPKTPVRPTWTYTNSAGEVIIEDGEAVQS